jgi:hypothetical protein
MIVGKSAFRVIFNRRKKQKNKRQGEQASQAFIVENQLSDDEQKI